MATAGIWRLLPNIRRQERTRFGYFALLAFFFNFAQTVGLAGSEALFLADLGAGQLPLALVLSSAAAVAASAVYASLVGRLRNDRLFIFLLLAGAAAVLVTSLALPLVPARYGLFAGVIVLQAVGITHFRTFATDYFDTLVSKRIFPALAMVASCGGAIGGGVAALIPWLADSSWLIVCWAAGLTLTAVWIYLGRTRLQRWKPDDDEEDAPEARQLRSALRWLRTNGLERSLAFSVATMVVAMSILHYISSVLLIESFPTAESLAAFLGVYLAVSNLVEILIARWVTPWLLQRVGVPGVQLFHPGLTAGAFLAVGIMPGLGTAILARANRELLENAFAGEVRNLAYNALPARLRGSVRALVEGGVFYASLSLGGLALLLVGDRVPIPWLAAGGLIAAGLYGFGAWQVGVRYLARVRAALREGRLELVGFEQIAGKPELAELANEWESIIEPSSACIISDAILELAFILSRAGYDSLVARASTHPAPRLRIACIRALAECESTEAAQAIVAALEDEDAHVREVAAHTLQGFRDMLPSVLAEAARRHANDSSPAVRAELALALGEQGIDLLSRQAKSQNSNEAVEAIARLPARHLAIAEARAEDPNSLVRAAALTRIAKSHDEEALRRIDVATAILHTDASLRCAAVRILARRGSSEAADSIGACLFDPSADVRELARLALIEFGSVGRDVARRTAKMANVSAAEAAFDILAALGNKGARMLRHQLRGRVERAWCIQFAIQEQAAGDSIAERFLLLALGNRLVQDVQAAFEILARLENRPTLRHIELGLQEGGAQTRADSLELLSHLGDRQATAALVLLLEGGSLLEKRSQLGGWLRLDHGSDELDSIGRESGDQWLELAIKNQGKGALASRPQEIAIMERLLGLRGVPLFTHLSLDQLSAIAGHTRVATYLAGEIIVEEGEQGETLYVLLEGEVDAIIGHDTLEEQIVNHLSAPDCFGELSILDGSPRSATILTRTDVRLLALDGPILREILTEVPQLAIDMLRALSNKLRTADDRSRNLLRELSETSD